MDEKQQQPRVRGGGREAAIQSQSISSIQNRIKTDQTTSKKHMNDDDPNAPTHAHTHTE